MNGVSGFNCVTERCPQRRNVVCEATAQYRRRKRLFTIDVTNISAVLGLRIPYIPCPP